MSYVVRPGDTLWSIASEQAGPDSDPRALLDSIARANGVTEARLVPGQRLVIPTKA